MPGKIFQFVAVCCSRLAFHEAVVFPWFERTCTSQITNEVSVWFLTEPVKLHKLCSTQCFISSDYIFFCFVSLLLPIALVFTCTVRVQWEVSVLSERWTSACTGGFLLSHFNIAGWTVWKLKKKKIANLWSLLICDQWRMEKIFVQLCTIFWSSQNQGEELSTRSEKAAGTWKWNGKELCWI